MVERIRALGKDIMFASEPNLKVASAIAGLLEGVATTAELAGLPDRLRGDKFAYVAGGCPIRILFLFSTQKGL